jgi:sigma54-dependent transcription regulator
MVAPTDSTVLITGESGTGKEVLARYIHQLSEREAGPFISINCGALPENLLESELFGHVKGSFTGAVRDKDGLLAVARGGTFFLDEVGEMSPALQVKLLRALQEREIVPVGATQPVGIDVRIIAATNRDLEQEIRRGGFRSDLYYRLNVITMHLPPLRDRQEDIALLAEHFLRRVHEGTRDDIHLSEGSARCAAALRLAGQRTRTGERTRARRDPDDRQRRHRTRRAAGADHRAGAAPLVSDRPPPTRRSRWWSAPTSCGCCRRRAATRRGPRKCSASIRPHSTAS